MPGLALKGTSDRRTIGSRRFKGASAIARAFGVSDGMIGVRLRRGETPEQICAYYRAQGLGKPTPKQAGSATVRSSVYQGANKVKPPQSQPQSQSYRPQLPSTPLTPEEQGDDAPAEPSAGLGWIPGAAAEMVSNEFATLNAAKIRKEVALADKHELDLAERRRELIDREKVNLYVSGMITRARDMILRVPGELRDRLAASANPVECERLLKKELTHALAALREYRPE